MVKKKMNRKQLLFVDDESAVLNTPHRTLRNLPYQKHFASSTEEGLEIIKTYPIGIVISDQRMPGMNETEFLKQVHTINPETVRVILSAYASIGISLLPQHGMGAEGHR